MESNTVHWSEQKEQEHIGFGLKLVVFLIKIVPPFFIYLITAPVAFFYFIFAKQARFEIKRYQTQLYSSLNLNKKVRYAPQFFSFALSLMEKLEAMRGGVSMKNILLQDIHGNDFDDIDDLQKNLSHGKGVLMIGSHLGNMELLRILTTNIQINPDKIIHTTVITNMNVSSKFMKAMKSFGNESMLDFIAADEIGIDTMSMLSERIQNGGIVIVTGDRTAKTTISRSLKMKFLGKDALFPYGIYLIAALLNAPTYFIFGLRTKNFSIFPKYEMHAHRAKTDFSCQRKERDKRIENLCREFVELLEKYCEKFTYQWYNFFDFWAIPKNMELE